MSTNREIDAVTGVETTGHTWDGIKELNKPLPRWWTWTFYATIVWAIGYWVVYPAWPTMSGYTPGIWKYSQRQTVAGAFMTIANHGKVDDRLIDGESPIADKVEIHSMTMDGNIMRMRPMPEGIAIPAHGSATLAPGGVHLMLTGLKRPIAGGMVPLTLRFAKAGKVSISLMVEPIGSSGGEDHHDHH